MLPFFALDPKKTAREARKLRDEGKWEKGYFLCKRALKTSPKDPDLLEISCELALLLKKFKEAIGHFISLRNYPEKRKKLIEHLIEHFDGEEKEKALLREQVLIELIAEGEIDRIETLFNRIPRKELEHFIKKHSEKDKEDFISGFFVYVILFYSKKYIESSLKLYNLYKNFKDKREIIKKEILRVNNMGYLKKYASFTNFLIAYDEGREENAMEYIGDFIDDENFYDYILDVFKKKKPSNSYFKLLFSHLLILKENISDSLKMLKEALVAKDVDKSYAYEIAKVIKNKKLNEDEINEIVEIFTKLGKTEEAANILKEKGKEKIKVESLRDSLLESFSPRAFRIFLEIEEGKIDENLRYLYEKNEGYLNDREVLGILKDLAEEKKIKSPFFLFSLSSSMIRNGEFKEGFLLMRYLLRKNFDIKLIEREIERKREDLFRFEEGYILYLELLKEKRDLKFFKIAEEFLNKFPSYSDYLFLLLDEAGIDNFEWNEEIIKFLEDKKKVYTDKVLLIEGLAFLRLKRFKEGVLRLYEAYKKGISFIENISEKLLKEQGNPEIYLLKGLIELEKENFGKAEEFLKESFKNKELLKEASRVIAEKLKEKKNKELLFFHAKILILWGKFDEALRFIEDLKKSGEIKYKGDFEAMESVVMWKKGEIEKAKDIIKRLIKEKIKFDPLILYEFLKEEEKKQKTPFIYQTLGSLALLLSKPKEAARYYYMLAINSPKIIPKIKDIFITIESKFPFFAEIELYKKGVEILEGKSKIEEVIKLYEENPEIKEEFLNFLEYFPEKEKSPYLLFLNSKIKFEAGKEYKDELKKSFELAIRNRNYNLIESIKEFVYERVKNDKDGMDLVSFILSRDIKGWEKFFKLIKEKSFIEKNKKEVFPIFRRLFISGVRDKDFIFTYADELSREDDKSCIYVYQEAIDKFPEEIEKRKDRWEKFIPECFGLAINLYLKLKNSNSFKEWVKKIIDNNLLGTYYAVIREAVKVFDYEENLFNLIKECAEKVKDYETEILVLKELAQKENKFIYYKELIDKLVEFKEEEVNIYWPYLVKSAVKEKRFSEFEDLWEKIYGYEKESELYKGDYLFYYLKKSPERLRKFLSGNRNFPLPLKEP